MTRTLIQATNLAVGWRVSCVNPTWHANAANASSSIAQIEDFDSSGTNSISSFSRQTLRRTCIRVVCHHAAPAELVMSAAEVLALNRLLAPALTSAAGVMYPLSTMKWLSSNQPNL